MREIVISFHSLIATVQQGFISFNDTHIILLKHSQDRVKNDITYPYRAVSFFQHNPQQPVSLSR